MIKQILNGKWQQRQTHLNESFQSGYKDAAIALSKIFQDKIYYNNFHHAFHLIENNSISKMAEISRAGTNILITTEILGDIPGKSYLLLGQHELDAITEYISKDINPKIDVKKEFVKELNNILLAAVVSKLSDHLGLKMFGDVPMWVGSFKGNIVNLICEDFCEEAEEVYISSSFFSFDNHPRVQPFYIWAMHNKILQAMSINPAYSI